MKIQKVLASKDLVITIYSNGTYKLNSPLLEPTEREVVSVKGLRFYIKDLEARGAAIPWGTYQVIYKGEL